MKAFLEFEIPQDEAEYNMANQGHSYHTVLWEISRKVRNSLKHGHKFKNADEALESIEKDIYNLMNEYQCYFQE